jgi:hypothetical protein
MLYSHRIFEPRQAGGLVDPHVSQRDQKSYAQQWMTLGEMAMPRSSLLFITAIALVATLTLVSSSNAQRARGEEGTGGAAGNMPPVDGFKGTLPLRSRSIRAPEQKPTPDQKPSAPRAADEKHDGAVSPDEPAKDK